MADLVKLGAVQIEKILADTDRLLEGISWCGEGIRSLGSHYIGIYNHIGVSTVENSYLCSKQISLALVMSNHPLIRELLRREEIKEEDFDPAALRKAQVLAGLKIMDLGCGGAPTFARCARRFGADVYSVDRYSANDFYFEEDCFSKEDRAIELAKHIQVDLNYPKALEQILAHSGGNFDLVTEAHLVSDGFYDGERIAMPLLKKGGIYYPLLLCDQIAKIKND